MTRRRLLIASQNRGKLREFQQLLGDRWEVVAPADVGVPNLHVVEDGDTYLENAARKARAYANAAGLPTLADDSGLEVDALGGAPGIHSARYAGANAPNEHPAHGDDRYAALGLTDQDAANRRKLLDALQGIPPQGRTARFRAVVVLTHPYGPNLRVGEGVVEGRIAADERGAGGFGYDPVFELPDGRRMAELAPEEKNDISHRARAVADLRWALDALAHALDRQTAAPPGGRNHNDEQPADPA